MYVLIIDSKDQQSYFAFDAMRLTENEEVVENFKKNQEKRLKNADEETSS